MSDLTGPNFEPQTPDPETNALPLHQQAKALKLYHVLLCEKNADESCSNKRAQLKLEKDNLNKEKSWVPLNEKKLGFCLKLEHDVKDGSSNANYGRTLNFFCCCKKCGF